VKEEDAISKKEKKNVDLREGAYLSSLASAFGMKHSSFHLLSAFLQR